jgi:carbonic anhydrase
MTDTASEFLRANAQYAARFDGVPRPVAPKRRLALLACMDSRIDLFAIVGLSPGDAHVIRNAGGRANEDALASLIISHTLMGTREFVVIHHTDCGMHNFTSDDLRQRIHERLGQDVSGMTFDFFTDLDESVRADVAAIRTCPYFAPDISVSGFVYDVFTGALRLVA